MRAGGREKHVIRRYLRISLALCVSQEMVKGVCLMRFVSTQHKAIEAEASVCTTLRANGTAPASGYARAEALLRRCAPDSKVLTLFEKCASWKIPEIPSKMRTFFQDAHAKLRTFERRTVGTRARVLGRSRCQSRLPPGSQAQSGTLGLFRLGERHFARFLISLHWIQGLPHEGILWRLPALVILARSRLERTDMLPLHKLPRPIRLRFALALAPVVVAVAAYAVAADAQANREAETAIRANVDAFVNAYNAGNAKAIGELFTPEGQLLDENDHTTHGRDAIEQAFASVFDGSPQGRIEVDVESIRLFGSALAVETGTTKSSTNREQIPMSRDTPSSTRNRSTASGRWRLPAIRRFDGREYRVTVRTGRRRRDRAERRRDARRTSNGSSRSPGWSATGSTRGTNRS